MNDILRALGRACISQFHPRMLWLAVWPFLVAAVVWTVIGYVFHRAAVDWLVALVSGTIVGTAIESGFATFDITGGLAALMWLVYVGILFGLVVLTALLIIATVAMPQVIAHVSGREYPALVRKRGGSFAGSVGNAM